MEQFDPELVHLIRSQDRNQTKDLLFFYKLGYKNSLTFGTDVSAL